VGDERAADARPEAPSIVCQALPDTATCVGWLPTCDTCHISTAPLVFNPFGGALLGRMPQDGDFETRLTAALNSLDSTTDSDADGTPDLVELDMLSNPGNAKS